MFRQIWSKILHNLGAASNNVGAKLGGIGTKLIGKSKGMTFGDALRSVKSKMGACGKPLERLNASGEKIVGERIYRTLDDGLVRIGQYGTENFGVRRYLGKNVNNSLYRKTIEGTTESIEVVRGLSISKGGKLGFDRFTATKTFASLSNEKVLANRKPIFSEHAEVKKMGGITTAPTVTKYTYKVKTITPETAHSIGLKVC